MAAAPKMTPEQWATVRAMWESDPREGFAWLPKQLSLTVSREACRKKSVSEGWKKKPFSAATLAKSGLGAMVALNVAPATIGRNTATIDALNAEEARPFKSRETPTLDMLDEDEPRQGQFVREYVKDLNATQAAIRAGYAEDSAHVTASRMLSTAKIQAAIRELRDELLRGIEVEAKDVLQTLVMQLRADINEISQYRRVCCQACWGERSDDGKHAWQCTPLEYEKKKLAHDRERTRLLDRSGQTVDIGEFPSIEGDWYDKRREPNPDCPECFGEGLGEVYFGDTRKLSKAAKALYGGVKVGKEGIEIIVSNREKVIDQLARVLGMFKDKDTSSNVCMPDTTELERIFHENMAKAHAIQDRVIAERAHLFGGESGS